MSLSIVVDARNLQLALEHAPEKVLSGLNSWVRVTALSAEREAKKAVPPRIDTGRTQSSIHTVFGTLQAIVKPAAPEAIFAHEGRRPGKMPPFGEGTTLNRWATKRGMNPFLVARSIGRKGIKPHRFMNTAFSIVRPGAEQAANRTLSQIVSAI